MTYAKRRKRWKNWIERKRSKTNERPPCLRRSPLANYGFRRRGGLSDIGFAASPCPHPLLALDGSLREIPCTLFFSGFVGVRVALARHAGGHSVGGDQRRSRHWGFTGCGDTAISGVAARS